MSASSDDTIHYNARHRDRLRQQYENLPEKLRQVGVEPTLPMALWIQTRFPFPSVSRVPRLPRHFLEAKPNELDENLTRLDFSGGTGARGGVGWPPHAEKFTRKAGCRSASPRPPQVRFRRLRLP